MMNALTLRRTSRQVLLGGLVVACALLAGCKKELYSGLSEEDVNEMAVALMERNVPADKSTPDGGKTYTLQVDDGDMVRAMEVLRERGLPHSKFDDLGNLFKKDGLVSTPTEERVRFIYGLSQELSGTLSHIDGVLVARVHIVQPERDPVVGQVAAPSASVMVRYRTDYNLELMRDKIRALVAGGVEGLSADRVNLTLIPVTPVLVAGDACSGVNACTAGHERDAHGSATLVLAALAIGVMLLSVSAWVWRSGIRSFSPTFFRRRGRGRAHAPATGSGDPQPATSTGSGDPQPAAQTEGDTH